MATLLREHLERCSVRVAPSSKRREPLQKSRNPLDVTALDRITKIIQFNRQESTHLPQIFDRPPRRCRAEFAVCCVDVRALLHQRPYDIAMSAKCRMMKRRGAESILLVDELAMPLNNGSNFHQVATLRSFD